MSVIIQNQTHVHSKPSERDVKQR